MIINRRIFKIKIGCMDQAIELIKAEIAATRVKGTVYTSDLGPSDLLNMDIEFEGLGKYDEFWTGWGQSARAEDFFKVWNHLVENHIANEIWQVQ
jgi:hypothetical protein